MINVPGKTASTIAWLLGAALLCLTAAYAAVLDPARTIPLRETGADTARPSATPSGYGIAFTCSPERLAQVRQVLTPYLASLGLSDSPAGSRDAQTAAHVIRETRPAGGKRLTLRYYVPSPSAYGTLFLAWRPEWALRDDVLAIPTGKGSVRTMATVSKKEILLALLSPGRLTHFTGRACNAQALIDHVGVRQNIVLWTEVLAWQWPDGDVAFWNRRYWLDGTPRKGVPLADALNDMFFRQSAYGFGCYTATKVVFVQGIYDYYRRVKNDAAQAQTIAKRLMADGEPLVDIEPGAMWRFESDFDPRELTRPGKLLRGMDGVTALNFVPGDWVYIRNTDPVSSQRTGYEGSNAIYMGRNRFDDYYNDNGHSYSFREKLDEVHQWRNGVFSRSRDYARLQPITYADIDRLGAPPERGGLLESIRLVPYFFGYEALPPLSPPPNGMAR